MKKTVQILAVMIIIRSIYKIYVYNFKYNSWNNYTIKVDIYCIDSVEDDEIKYIVKHNGDKFILSIKDKDRVYSYGDRLTIICSNYNIKKYGNPYEFNYKLYLNSNNIISKLYCAKVINVEERNNKYLDFVFQIRDKISQRLDKNMEHKKSNLMKSFMYGDDIYIDREIKEKFINIGLGHILCVSGTHIGYLIKSFEDIVKSKKKSIINIFILIYFYIISLFNISLLRPIIMYILSLFNNKMNFYKKYLISLMVILTLNPYYIFNVGIIFSFLSILSIKIFYSIINSYFELKIKSKNKVLRYIIQNISMTLSSQILILPFQLYYFQKISLICIVSNLLISFTINIFMYFIFLLFILIFIPIISNFIIVLCDKLLEIIILQVDILDKINYFNITFPKPNITFFLIFYIIIIIYLYDKLVIVLWWKRRKILKKIFRIIKKSVFVI